LLAIAEAIADAGGPTELPGIVDILSEKLRFLSLR